MLTDSINSKPPKAEFCEPKKFMIPPQQGEKGVKMKLVVLNKEEVNIEPGASVSRMSTVIENYTDLENLENKLTKENLKVANFVEEDVTVSTYTNMCVIDPLFIITKKDGKMFATFGLRNLTESELQEEDVQTALTYLTDEQALTVKSLVPNWKDDPTGYEYSMDNPLDLRRNFNGGPWKLKKSHAKQADWYPGADPTLWEQIVEDHDGTLEDPIPVPDSVTTSGFTYVYGKYYIEGETIYLCKRGGVENPEEMYGQEETLYYGPSAMVGQYFELAE